MGLGLRVLAVGDCVFVVKTAIYFLVKVAISLFSLSQQHIIRNHASSEVDMCEKFDLVLRQSICGRAQQISRLLAL